MGKRSQTELNFKICTWWRSMIASAISKTHDEMNVLCVEDTKKLLDTTFIVFLHKF